MKKTIAIAMLMMLAAACEKPLAQVDSGNEDFRVTLMGHIPDHGCDVYSIQNGSAYAVICPKEVLPTDTTEEHSESCGKGCHMTVRTPVIVRQSETKHEQSQ